MQPIYLTEVCSLCQPNKIRALSGLKQWLQADPARHYSTRTQIILQGLFIYALVQILFNGFLWLNHIPSVLFLDLMEGTVLQHVRQLAEGAYIYPAPRPEYVPLAYNPLYYVISVPFGWIFGLGLPTLRFVAVLGMAGTGLMLFMVVFQKTRSRWWALITIGLFAAAYRVMDTYLDNAHSDSWFLFTALLGTYMISQNRSRAWNLTGVLVLAASFWFKQHGAVFTIGGVLYLTWREGLRRSIIYWLAAGLFGPLSYIVAGPLLFGPYFIYFTWQVPRNWVTLDLYTLARLARFVAVNYPFLAVSALLGSAWTAFRHRSLTIWEVQLVFALLTAVMGALDNGSVNNVFIPMGTWFILMGVWKLHDLAVSLQTDRTFQIVLAALVVSFALFFYNPLTVIRPQTMYSNYTDLIAFLRGLQGTVYAPGLGQLEGDYVLYPAAHWVALDDMIRGPGRDTANHPLVRELLQPAISPTGPAYVLTSIPLENIPSLGFLNAYYVLDTDLGDRFQPLRLLPKRYNHYWPRYLYRYDPQAAQSQHDVKLILTLVHLPLQ